MAGIRDTTILSSRIIPDARFAGRACLTVPLGLNGGHLKIAKHRGQATAGTVEARPD